MQKLIFTSDQEHILTISLKFFDSDYFDFSVWLNRKITDYCIQIIVLFSSHICMQLTTNIFKTKSLKIGWILYNCKNWTSLFRQASLCKKWRNEGRAYYSKWSVTCPGICQRNRKLYLQETILWSKKPRNIWTIVWWNIKSSENSHLHIWKLQKIWRNTYYPYLDFLLR